MDVIVNDRTKRCHVALKWGLVWLRPSPDDTVPHWRSSIDWYRNVNRLKMKSSDWRKQWGCHCWLSPLSLRRWSFQLENSTDHSNMVCYSILWKLLGNNYHLLLCTEQTVWAVWAWHVMLDYSDSQKFTASLREVEVKVCLLFSDFEK
jgi:hypothetical protein